MKYRDFTKDPMPCPPSWHAGPPDPPEERDEPMSEWDQHLGEDLVNQLQREHQEGIAADRLESERRKFAWDIEGWDGDLLLIYIPGVGLLRMPSMAAGLFAHSILSEIEIHRTEFE